MSDRLWRAAHGRYERPSSIFLAFFIVLLILLYQIEDLGGRVRRIIRPGCYMFFYEGTMCRQVPVGKDAQCSCLQTEIA